MRLFIYSLKTNSDGNITVKVSADIFNLDTDELRKKLDQE